MHHQGSWHLSVDGEHWGGSPDHWHQLEGGRRFLFSEDPHWLLGLLDGCIEATSVDTKDLQGERWDRARVRCDFKLAADHSDLPFITPLDIIGTVDRSAGDFDLANIPVPDQEMDVWTDSSNRIRRVIRYTAGRLRSELALDDFGVDAGALKAPIE